MIEIRRCSFEEIAAGSTFAALLEEYGRECHIPELGEPQAQMGIYASMSRAGLFHMLGAYVDGELAGFAVLIVNLMPHYGRKLATAESFFVGEAYRKHGVGPKLLRESERLAKSLGAVGIGFSAPKGGRMERWLPHVGYDHTNTSFFKALA